MTLSKLVRSYTTRTVGPGGFGTIDPRTGKYEPIVDLLGFTRGLSFCGSLAFIGLSQVRDWAVFGGIPIADRTLEERVCGVWVVNIQTNEVTAFVKFEDAVQEIFAVEVLHVSRYPKLVNEDRELLANSYELPDSALADVPDEHRNWHAVARGLPSDVVLHPRRVNADLSFRRRAQRRD